MEAKEERLVQLLREYSRVIVAFSGGVDSSYLAFMAHRVLGEGARAVTALSPAVSQWQRALARSFAATHYLNHHCLRTAELELSDYRSNTPQRCYFCKDELFGVLDSLKQQWEAEVILDGTNSDDLGDFRPGLRAGRRYGVRSPLAELEMSKEEIRLLSRGHHLSSAELPAMPCLSSRFPYGVPISEEALRQVEAAEERLRELGLVRFRVRHHGDMARLELARDEMHKLLDARILETVDRDLRRIGYRRVTLDMAGFRSGSLNDDLETEVPRELVATRPDR